MTAKKKKTCSVREIAAFVFRSGGLGGGKYHPDRALEGARAHRKLQKKRGSDYRAEVKLNAEFTFKETTYLVSGRADGILIQANKPPILEEIKTTVNHIPKTFSPVDMAQAKLYAAMADLAEFDGRIVVRICYYNIHQSIEKHFEINLTQLELSDFFNQTMQTYARWMEKLDDHIKKRDASIDTLSFPFPFRAGQRNMAAHTFMALKNQKTLFLCAPTGLGKTIGVLFSGLKAVGLGHAKTILYVTAKSTGKQEAEKAAINLQMAGCDLKVLTLHAKEKICPVPELFCDTQICPYAVSFYDTFHQCLEEALPLSNFNLETILRLSEKYMLCPHQLSQELGFWMDILIGDYSYAFDPDVQIKSLFDKPGKATTVMVDEAHNLPDRARSMYSATCFKKSLLLMRKTLHDTYPMVSKNLWHLNKEFIEINKQMKRESRSILIQASPSQSTIDRIYACVEKMEEALDPTRKQQTLLDAYFKMRTLKLALEHYDVDFSTIWEKKGEDIQLSFYCHHPARCLKSAIKNAASLVYFSATLHPLDFFKEELGGTGDDPVHSLPSPFPRKNLLLMIAPYLSTRMRDRKNSLALLCQTLSVSVQKKTGNYLFFFPSYEYMEMVWQAFDPGENQVLKQDRSLSETGRLDFLNRFQEDPSQTHIGFCVLGSVFAEGIDLSGTRLHGVTITGVSLPPVSTRGDIIRSYHDDLGRDGYAYAFRYPGWVRVLQAAGRVIRSSTDRGVVILIGDRFTSADYRPLFPEQWLPPVIVDHLNDLKQQISFFWS